MDAVAICGIASAPANRNVGSAVVIVTARRSLRPTCGGTAPEYACSEWTAASDGAMVGSWRTTIVQMTHDRHNPAGDGRHRAGRGPTEYKVEVQHILDHTAVGWTLPRRSRALEPGVDGPGMAFRATISGCLTHGVSATRTNGRTSSGCSSCMR